ncbi:MAG: hypothetical protein AAGA20_21035 [Planctomycetota bacterium]
MVDHQHLRELLGIREHPCVTITLPTAVRGPETLEGSIRLKNVLREVAACIGEDGEAERDILRWLGERVDDADYWQHQREGLMLLASPSVREEWRFPTTLPENVRIERRFHLKYAIRLANSPTFEVLAFSRGSVRLLRCDSSHVDVIEVPGLTTSLAEFTQYDEHQDSLQHHSTGSTAGKSRRAPVTHHGHGSNEERHTEDLERFAKAVAKRIDQRRASMMSPPPLLLAATTRDAAAYRNASRDPRLEPGTIEGNHDRTEPETLRAAVWEHAAEARLQRQAAARERVVQAINSDAGSTTLTRVLAAAHQGLVHTLFAAHDADQRGHFNVAESAVLRTGIGTPEAGDLVDEAACMALQYGADVYVVAKDDLPAGDSVAAQFRS